MKWNEALELNAEHLAALSVSPNNIVKGIEITEAGVGLTLRTIDDDIKVVVKEAAVEEVKAAISAGTLVVGGIVSVDAPIRPQVKKSGKSPIGDTEFGRSSAVIIEM